MEATKRRTKNTPKSTQTYTCIDLYEGPAEGTVYSEVAVRSQQENPIRISILQGQYSSTFVINRRREGVSKNGKPWKKWETWGQLTMSTRALNKAGVKKLNLYTKYRTKHGAALPWMPFRNATADGGMINEVVKGEFIYEVNKEIERLVTENIGKPEIDREKYFAVTDQTHPGIGFRERAEISKNFYSPHLYAMHIAYPLMRHLKLEDYRLPQGITTFLRHETMMEGVRAMYGKTLYRKDLVKAASQSPTVYRLIIAREFRNIVPVDWIIDFLNAEKTIFDQSDLSKTDIKTLRTLFKSLTPAQQRRYLKELTSGSKKIAAYWEITDTLRMFNQLERDFDVTFVPGQIQAKGWHELHEAVRLDLRDRRHVKREIKQVDLAKDIAKVTFKNGYQVIQPADTHELMDWGNKMGHCIGSYASEAFSGQSVFLGIIKDGKMIGNAQIKVKAKRLMQIFGKHNALLDDEVLDAFAEPLIKQKVLPKTAFQNAAGFRAYAGQL